MGERNIDIKTNLNIIANIFRVFTKDIIYNDGKDYCVDTQH